MRKINVDIVIKVVILLGFSIFFYSIILNGKIMRFVHPRVIPYIIIGALGMILIVIFSVPFIFKGNKVRRKKLKYIIYMIPLIIAFSLQGEWLKGILIDDDNREIGKLVIEDDNSDKNIGSTEVKERIFVSDKNFINFVEESAKEINEYMDKEIEIVGFINQNDSYNNEFDIARFSMTCCTSDMSIVGIKCNSKNEYEEGTWVKAVGELEGDELKGISILKIKSIEIVEPPNNQYVYPF